MLSNAHATGNAAADALVAQAASGRLSHAVIIDGADAQTRLAAARNIAAALVCSGEKKPCGECDGCVKALAASHPDIMTYSGSGASASFSVDTVRAIRSQAYIMPNEADRKVFILSGASSMSIQAQNALLKILEEPPAFVTFILECRSRSVLLPTVLSRADSYSLGEDTELSAADERVAAATEKAIRLARAMCSGSESEVINITGEFEKDKELFKLCLTELVPILGRTLKEKCGGNSCDSTIEELSATVTRSRLIGLIDAVSDCLLATERNANHNLLISRLASTTATERIC